MRISFLLTEFGFTGGPVNLLKFMDKLSERGYEVYAITPAKRIAWRPGLSKTIIKQMTHPSTLQRIQDYPISCASYIYRKLPRFHHISQAIYRSYYSYYLNTLTRNLLSKWIPSDITVATHCLTAYAAFALMDKTIPLYYIQHFEELFFQDELVQKLARLTYFMPIELITGGHGSAIRSSIGQAVCPIC